MLVSDHNCELKRGLLRDNRMRQSGLVLQTAMSYVLLTLVKYSWFLFLFYILLVGSYLKCSECFVSCMTLCWPLAVYLIL